MSIKLMSLAWDADLPLAEKAVLLCLCDHANDDGECWPSMARVARRSSMSERTAQRAIKGLRDKGILTWDDAPGRSHKFAIDPRRLRSSEGAHYVYRVEDALTGEFYIGARSCLCEIGDDPYMGSGAWVSEAIRVGRKLTKHILQVCSGRDDLAEAEQQWVADLIGDPLCRNRRLASAGSLTPVNLSPRQSVTPTMTAKPPTQCHPTPDTVSPKPSRTVSEPSKSNIARKPDGVSDAVWADYSALRKAKRAPLTETALASIQREATAAGWTLEAALSECSARGWQAFKAAWVKEAPNVRSNQRPERSTTRQTGERVAARFAAGSGGAAHILPRLGPPGGYD